MSQQPASRPAGASLPRPEPQTGPRLMIAIRSPVLGNSGRFSPARPAHSSRRLALPHSPGTSTLNTLTATEEAFHA